MLAKNQKDKLGLQPPSPNYQVETIIREFNQKLNDALDFNSQIETASSDEGSSDSQAIVRDVI